MFKGVLLVLAFALWPMRSYAADFEVNGLKLGSSLKSLPKSQYAGKPLMDDTVAAHDAGRGCAQGAS